MSLYKNQLNYKTTIPRAINKAGKFLWKDLKKYRYIYIMAVPMVLYYVLFHYLPMYGAQIAFKNFYPGKGIWESPWVGLLHFKYFFGSDSFVRILRNTVLLSFFNLMSGFPIPIIFALLLNEVRRKKYKNLVQTISYLPHFISVVIVCGMIIDFTSKTGAVNDIIAALGFAREPLLIKPELFRLIYISTDIWQRAGWESIIYISALTVIDPQIYEAAIVDGAGRWKQLWNVTIPGILPTMTVLLILRIGQIMNVGFEKIILLYNPSIYETADVISSFVYRKGLLDFSYSYSTAVGLFNSVINFTILIIANRISRSINENSLW